jgi:hypothetical protein
LPEGHRFTFTDAWRSRFARAGAALAEVSDWKRVGEVIRVAKAKTIQHWERLRKAGKLTGDRRGPGRPRVQAMIERVIKPSGNTSSAA